MSENKTTATAVVNPCDKVFSKTTVKNYCAAFLGQFACQGLAYAMFSSFLSVVYVNYLGVQPAAISLVMSVGVFVDMITDIIMGNIVDRVHTKWGKIRHWFFWMAVPVALTIGLMWMVPVTASDAVKLIWALVIYNAYCTALTGVRLPAFSIASICSDNSRVRTLLVWIASEGTTVASTVTGWVITPVVQLYQDNPLTGWRLLSWLMAGATLILLLVAGTLVTEKRTGADLERIEAERRAMKHTDKSMSFREQYSYLLRNKYWIRFQLAGIFNGMSMGFMIGSMGYWIQDVLTPAGVAGSNPLGVLTTIMQVPMMIAPFVTLVLIRFMDARNIIIMFLSLSAIFTLSMWGVGISLWPVFVVLMVCRQTVAACSNSCLSVMLTRAIDYGEWKFGVRQEGVGASFSSAINKVTMGIATAILGFVLAASGYTAGATNNSAALNLLFVGLPGICTACAAILYVLSMSGKEWKKIRAELDERHAGELSDAIH